jgi:hypothetical protein
METWNGRFAIIGFWPAATTLVKVPLVLDAASTVYGRHLSSPSIQFHCMLPDLRHKGFSQKALVSVLPGGALGAGAIWWWMIA